MLGQASQTRPCLNSGADGHMCRPTFAAESPMSRCDGGLLRDMLGNALARH